MTASPSVRADLDRQLGAESGAELSRVLEVLVQSARDVLGDALVGVYLTGSFALGCADHASDVDFVVISARALTDDDEQAVRDVHRALPDRSEHWAHRLEGNWVSAAALEEAIGAGEPWLRVNNGSREMERSRHDDTPNARWVLRRTGIALIGPPPSGLVADVSAEEVRTEAVTQADARRRWVHDDPEALRDGWSQPYAVLTHCRLLWSAEQGTVAGKADAAEWVRDSVAPARFRELITASIGYRLHAFDPSSGRADPGLVEVAADFVDWATREVRRRAGAPGGPRRALPIA